MRSKVAPYKPRQSDGNTLRREHRGRFSVFSPKGAGVALPPQPVSHCVTLSRPSFRGAKRHGNPSLPVSGNGLPRAFGPRNDKAGTTASYVYNADGQRISKTVNGTTTEYHYAGGKLSHVVKGSEFLHINYDALGPWFVNYDNGTTSTVHYFLRNAQGDILGLVNAHGVVVVAYTYDAWGNVLSTTGSMANTLGALNPLRYRGYVYDTETGLYYLNSRYYNPSWGRFINADIFVSTGQGVLGSNMFAYCNNNPVMGYDPTGQLDWRAASSLLVRGGSLAAATISGLSTFFHTGSVPIATVSFTTTFSAINNTVNTVYYNYFSTPQSSIEKDPDVSTYTKEYVPIWDRLDLARQETTEEKYTHDARAYYAEYSAHMYCWELFGDALGKDIPIASWLAYRARKADIKAHEADKNLEVRIATTLFSILGL